MPAADGAGYIPQKREPKRRSPALSPLQQMPWQEKVPDSIAAPGYKPLPKYKPAPPELEEPEPEERPAYLRPVGAFGSPATLMATAKEVAVEGKSARVAENQYSDAVHARGVGSDIQGPHLPGKGVGVGEVDRMTPEEYAALTDQQRAAVDFNTMLVRSVNKDLNRQDDYNPDAKQRELYDAQVRDMFGEGGGSDTYAPETLAVLKQIDFSNTTADLDEFINLNAAITAEDIKTSLTAKVPFLEVQERPVWQAASTEPSEVRTDMVQTLANRTQSMQAALVKGAQLLQSMQATAARDRNGFVGAIGGIENKPRTMLGYGTPTGSIENPTNLDGYFQQAFYLLANKKSELDRNQVLAAVNEKLNPELYQDFMAYADARSANAERYGLDLYEGEGDYKLRSPEEFRKMLGLEEAAR